MIIKGIGGELLGVGEMNFGNLADVHILIISYSAIRKGCALAVHEVNIVQSSLKNLHNDLTYFIKNNSSKSSSSSHSKKRKFNIRKSESNVWKIFKNFKGEIKMSGNEKKLNIMYGMIYIMILKFIEMKNI